MLQNHVDNLSDRSPAGACLEADTNNSDDGDSEMSFFQVCCGVEEEEKKPTWIDVDENGDDDDEETNGGVTVRKKAAIALSLKRRNTVWSKPVDCTCDSPLPSFPKTPDEIECIETKLRSYFVLEDLPSDDMSVLIDAFERYEVSKGTTIGKQDEEEDFYYVIQEGHVDLWCENYHHKVGSGFDAHGDNAGFGEMSLFYGCKRFKTQRAATDLVCWRIGQTTFRTILARRAHARDNDLKEKLRQIDLFKGLDDVMLNKFALNMTTVDFNADDLIVRKGEEGDVFYIIEEGSVKVHDIGMGDSQSAEEVLSAGDWFGERALLTDEPRAANVTALTARVKTLAMDRDTFVSSFGELQALLEFKERVQSVRAIPIFSCKDGHSSTIEDFEIERLASLATEMCFKKGTKLAVAGQPYQQNIWMIRHGRLLVYGTKSDRIYNLSVGDYFGDKSVLGEADRISSHDAVCEENLTTWVLAREDIEAVVGNLDRLGEAANYEKKTKVKRNTIKLKDLKRHQILGVGGFGRVWLVEHDKSGEPYALKMMNKRKILSEKQEKSVMREKELLAMLDHPFILNLVGSFQDEDNLYLILPLIQGGELFSIVAKSFRPFGANESIALPNKHAAFYGACVIEALGHFHHRHIAYRDLKLENVMIDSLGYGKIVDLGFAKVVLGRTYTFCGTPEYVAPEVIISRGHNHAADYWSYGVLLFELLVGTSPFTASAEDVTINAGGDQMAMFKRIVMAKYTFPMAINDSARDLIRQLLNRNQIERLGNRSRGHLDVRVHPWFGESGCDFRELLRRKVEAPWVPEFKDVLDSSNFDDYTEMEKGGDNNTGMWLTEEEQDIFKGF